MKIKSLCIIFIIPFILLTCGKKVEVEKIKATFILGEVTKNSIALNTGDEININDSIKTGKNSLCDLKIGESMIRIKENSELKMLVFVKNQAQENIEVDLSMGKALCIPKKLLKSDSFVIKTPTAVAGVRGTKFVVATSKDKKTTVKVLDGKVKVAKRIKLLENSQSKVLEISPVVSEKEMIEITDDDVKKSEIALK